MDLILARRKAKLSREKAAVGLGISFSTLVRWEKGISRMPADILPKLKEAYSLSESEIIELCEDCPKFTRKRNRKPHALQEQTAY